MEAEAAAVAAQAAVTRAVAEALCPNLSRGVLSATFTGTRGCGTWVPSPEAGRSTRVTVAVVDTFVWQALASVAIPGFTINRICAASLYVLGTATRWPLAVRKWTTTAVGLLAIPVIIHPIDRSVDFLLDSSLRKLYPSVQKPSS